MNIFRIIIWVFFYVIYKKIVEIIFCFNILNVIIIINIVVVFNILKLC